MYSSAEYITLYNLQSTSSEGIKGLQALILKALHLVARILYMQFLCVFSFGFFIYVDVEYLNEMLLRSDRNQLFEKDFMVLAAANVCVLCVFWFIYTWV